MIPPLETLPPRRSEWGSSLPPDCFVSTGSISPCEYFLTMFFYGEVLAPRPTPKLKDHPSSACLRLLIQYIRSYPPYRRSFLHPQSEDAPCRGDRDPLITVIPPIHDVNIPTMMWMLEVGRFTCKKNHSFRSLIFFTLFYGDTCLLFSSFAFLFIGVIGYRV